MMSWVSGHIEGPGADEYVMAFIESDEDDDVL